MVLTETSTDTLTRAPQSAVSTTRPAALAATDRFASRHIGPSAEETRAMLETVGFPALDAMVDEAIPSQIRLGRPLHIPPGRTEYQVLADLKQVAAQNQVFRSYIGMGYSDCITPAVI